MKCAWRNCINSARSNPYKGHTPIYCSIKCKNKAMVDNLRHKRKLEAIKLLGGKCSRCGYNKCPTALQFHHINPKEKDFRISQTTNWNKLKDELKKCSLVCANCHAEIHYEIENNVSFV